MKFLDRVKYSMTDMVQLERGLSKMWDAVNQIPQSDPALDKVLKQAQEAEDKAREHAKYMVYASFEIWEGCGYSKEDALDDLMEEILRDARIGAKH